MTIAMKAPSRYVQGPGILSQLGLNAKKMGTKFFVLCSANSVRRFGEDIESTFAEQGHESVFSKFNGESTKEEVFEKMDVCKDAGCDCVVGLGGGKVIDTAKTVAENLGLPCIIVPTIASNDAPCSGVAVLYNDAGIVVKAVLTKRNPDLVLVDTQIIADAPARFFVAGMGDALATWFEARACEKSGAKNMARGQVTRSAMAIAKLCYETLLADGKAALDAVQEKTVTPEVERVVEASILMSGIGFESGGLAAAHAINDGLAHEPQVKAYHGEKVGFGTLVQLVLENAKEIDEVLEFMKSVGLPMTLKELGVETLNPETLMKVAEAACVKTQSTKNLSRDITAQDVYEAIIKADEIGKTFLMNNEDPS